MEACLVPKLKLNDGNAMPIIGLGTNQPFKVDVYEVVVNAVEAGYRHFDCAFAYGNEQQIGKALNDSIESGKVSREELFVTTKLWMTYKRPDRVSIAINKSLNNLGLNYIDLYLMHWPQTMAQVDHDLFPKHPNGDLRQEFIDYVQTWKAMEDCVCTGLAKSIGVSNFNSRQIERICNESVIRPVINQIESHPYLAQKGLIEFCERRGIKITAYSPFGNPGKMSLNESTQTKPQLLDDQTVNALAKKYGKSAAQILAKFHTDRGVSVVPKSANKERMYSNIQIFDFNLNSSEINELESLDRGYRTCPLDMANMTTFENYPFIGVNF